MMQTGANIIDMNKIALAWQIFTPILWPHIKPLLIIAVFILFVSQAPRIWPQHEGLMIDFIWLFALAGMWLAHSLYSRTD